MSATVYTLFEQGVFDPDATQAMGTAYDGIAKDLGLSKDPTYLNTLVAQKIIAIAKTGERDPNKLRSATVLALADQL